MKTYLAMLFDKLCFVLLALFFAMMAVSAVYVLVQLFMGQPVYIESIN